MGRPAGGNGWRRQYISNQHPGAREGSWVLASDGGAVSPACLGSTGLEGKERGEDRQPELWSSYRRSGQPGYGILGNRRCRMGEACNLFCVVGVL